MTIVAIGFFIVFFGLIGLVWQLGDRDDHAITDQNLEVSTDQCCFDCL